MTFTKHPLCYLIALAPISGALAVTNDVNVDLHSTFEFSDNALRRSENPIDERKDKYEAGVLANYTNEWAILNADYDLEARRFEKESQPNRSFLNGEADVHLGSAFQPYSLNLRHSSRSLYNAPDEVELTSNLDEREIFSAQPMARWKLNSSDALVLSGNYSDISYRFAEGKNSTMKGANLTWELGFSKADMVAFSVDNTRVDFDQAAGLGYTRQTLSARYAVKLHDLEYSVLIGANRVTTDSDDDNFVRPSFDVSAAYQDGYDTFKLMASRRITDTSTGNGNQAGLGLANPAGGTGADIIDYSSAELSWVTTVVCERCTVNVNLFGTKQDYQRTPQSHTEKGGGAGFDYRFSRALSVNLQALQSKRTFVDNAFNDYKMTRATLSVSYKFQNDFQAKIYRELEKRDSDLSTKRYDEHITGISLSYVF